MRTFEADHVVQNDVSKTRRSDLQAVSRDRRLFGLSPLVRFLFRVTLKLSSWPSVNTRVKPGS